MPTATIRRPLTGHIAVTFDFDNPPAGQPCRAIDAEIHYRVTPRESRSGCYPGSGPVNEIVHVVPLALHVMNCDDPMEWQTWQADCLPAGVSPESLACEILTVIGTDDRLAERIDWDCMAAAGEV